jgi:cytochrome b
MTEPLKPLRVWDLPTRAFHWALAACVIASVLSAKIGGDAMVWHLRLGYAVLALLAFRLLWGFVGGRWSRFSAFAYAPSTVWRYLRGRHGPHEHLEVGHSPLGALSVFALLALLALQAGTGLAADDEIATTGPLVAYVSSATSLAFTRWHKGWGQWLVIGLALLHVVAIAAYALRRRNLVRPMLAGDKLLPAHVPASADHAGTRLLALVLLASCSAGVAWLVSLGG